MRTAYHEQLEGLTNRLGEMCGLAGVAMERATQALLQADLVLAEQVISDHEQIATLSAHAEEQAFVLLALQSPVAGDLRSVVGSIQIVADVDRMGALALHVAKIARRRHPQHTLPEEVNGYFAEMGRVAVELGTSAQEVLLSRDPEKAARIANASARDSRDEVAERGGEAGSYEDWTKDELAKRARELDIEGRSTMTKDELIEALRNH